MVMFPICRFCGCGFFKNSSRIPFLVWIILYSTCSFFMVLTNEKISKAGSIQLQPLPFPPPTQVASDFKQEFMEIADIAMKNAIPALGISLIIRKLSS